MAGAGMVPVARAEMATDDMDLIGDFVSATYVTHRPQLRRTGGGPVESGSQMAQAGALAAGLVHWRGVTSAP